MGIINTKKYMKYPYIYFTNLYCECPMFHYRTKTGILPNRLLKSRGLGEIVGEDMGEKRLISKIILTERVYDL